MSLNRNPRCEIDNNSSNEHGLDEAGIVALRNDQDELVGALLAGTGGQIDVGSLRPHDRLVAQRNAALTAAVKMARRSPEVDSGFAIIEIITALSDNGYGRATISIERIARIVKRDVRSVDRRVKSLVAAGSLCRQRLDANTVASWVPVGLLHAKLKPADIVTVLAPKQPRGRPRKPLALDAGVSGYTPAPNAGAFGERPRHWMPGDYENTPASDAGVNRKYPGTGCKIPRHGVPNTPAWGGTYSVDNIENTAPNTTNYNTASNTTSRCRVSAADGSDLTDEDLKGQEEACRELGAFLAAKTTPSDFSNEEASGHIIHAITAFLLTGGWDGGFVPIAERAGTIHLVRLLGEPAQKVADLRVGDLLNAAQDARFELTALMLEIDSLIGILRQQNENGLIASMPIVAGEDKP